MIGVLVQCDESIKAIIEKIDGDKNNTIVLETLDEETLLIQASRINELKEMLKLVRFHCFRHRSIP